MERKQNNGNKKVFKFQLCFYQLPEALRKSSHFPESQIPYQVTLNFLTYAFVMFLSDF